MNVAEGATQPVRVVAVALLLQGVVNGQSLVTLVPADAQWRFFRGTEAPSAALDWADEGSDDADWERGRAGFGYGDDTTVLDDMRGEYTSVYIRHEFVVAEDAILDGGRGLPRRLPRAVAVLATLG